MREVVAAIGADIPLLPSLYRAATGAVNANPTYAPIRLASGTPDLALEGRRHSGHDNRSDAPYGQNTRRTYLLLRTKEIEPWQGPV